MTNSFKTLAIWFSCACLSISYASAKTITGMSQGTLRAYLTTTELTNETHLEISGTINGDDLGVIRNMLKNYNLYSVNLRNAVIVKGGTVGGTYQSEVAGSYGDYEETNNIVVDENNTIPEGLFYKCDKLQYIHLPESITKIGYRAFYGCSNLKSLGFGDVEKSKLLTIGEETFSRCGSLQYLEIPEHTEEIGLAAFSYCTNLTTIKLGVGRLQRILEEAFMGCTKLTDVSLPDNLLQLGGGSYTGHVNHDQGVFAYCRALESVNFTNTFNTLSVKGKAFNECTALKTVSNTYQEDWFDIKFEYAQGNPTYYSHSLTFATGEATSSIVIPEGKTSLSDFAFINCENITSVEFPTTIMSVGTCAFTGCINLEEVRIKDLAGWSVMNFRTSYEYVPVYDPYGNIAYSYDQEDGAYQLNRQILTAESPMRYAKRFYVNGELLEDLVIPEGVTSIGNCAFSNIPHLRSVKLPTTLTSIGILAFENCTNIKTVYAPSQSIWNSINFKSIYNSGEIVILGEKNSDGYYYDYDIHGATKLSSDPTIYGATLLFDSVNLVDGEDYVYDYTKELYSLTFTKTFSASAAGNWNALYVPMSIDVEEYADEFEIAEIYAFCATVDTNGDGKVDATDENYLFVYPVKEGVTLPNVPYLIKPREAKTYTVNSADNVLYAKEDGKVSFGTTRDNFTVTGLNEAFTVTTGDNNYYVSASGKLNYRTTGSTTVKANRWIMHRQSKAYGSETATASDEYGARGYRILAVGEDIDETTAINAVRIANGELCGKGAFYNIDGRKMREGSVLPAGIYIKNGKKIVIK